MGIARTLMQALSITVASFSPVLLAMSVEDIIRLSLRATILSVRLKGASIISLKFSPHYHSYAKMHW